MFREEGVGIAKIKQITYSASTISELTNVQIQNIIDHVNLKTMSNLSQSEHIFLKIKEDLPESKKTLSEKQNNPVHIYANFCNKTLEQYPDIFYEFNKENIDYYKITDEASCPLCKLDHDDEEGIEGRYETRRSKIRCSASSYYIKCK
ncbi:16568_t:CDS:2 [Cetraspora pellucida]|uniref:16568_t:CDS:1 n=1 Tax=Cetraspora pellucida TaxID=1433469 RepID=A0ACA9N7F9_9GLOM|nr:16568_t:CDS:2 [Cetraspora pellucida]